MIKVSVVVPVYNPGNDIDDCIRSLVSGQSLSTDEYEVIFVDDGSTDATPQRLDALAGEHPHVRVEHIPNSGWPGRPRNVGIGLARGEYVYFVDNDDYLGEEALERLYAMAVADDADVVVGKVVSDDKQVPRVLFRKNRHAVTLEKAPFLLSLLSPHKLFRKAFVDQYDIRFPEGRRRLEDHVFVVHAYLHAERISVLSDYPCYYWVVRDDKSNASISRFDPAAYYGNVREVLDIVEAHTEPGAFRERLLSHWYRGKVMKRIGGGNFLRHDAAYRHELYAEIRSLAIERYGDWVDPFLGFNLRVRSHLLRHATEDALVAMAKFEKQLRAQATLREVEDSAAGVVLHVEGRMTGDRPLVFRRAGDQVVWVAPKRVRAEAPDAVYDATADVEAATAQILLRSTADGAKFMLFETSSTLLQPLADGDLEAVVTSVAPVPFATAAAGTPLAAGEWEILALVNIAGFYDTVTVQHPDGRPALLTADSDGTVRVAAAADPGDGGGGSGLLRRAARVLGGT